MPEEIYLSDEDDAILEHLWDVIEEEGILEDEEEELEEDIELSIDVHGREHKDKGPGGGQFVSRRHNPTIGLPTNRGKNATTDKLEFKLEQEKKTRRKVTKPKVIGTVIDIVTFTKDRIRYDPKKHRKVIDKARAKAAKNPPPTKEEVEYNLARLADMGAQQFRRGLVGNSTDRRKRREKLLKEFGDGKTCNCVYCGIEITHGTMEQDKIYTTAQGGRYRMPNIVPACSSCNKERSDADFSEALKMAERYYAERSN